MPTRSCTRPHGRGTGKGRIQATRADYAAVHALIAVIVSQGIALSVPAKVRSTVEAAGRALSAKHGTDLSVKELATALHVHDSNARRRAYECFSLGYLRNQSAPGRPMRITLGEALPEDRVHCQPRPSCTMRARVRARSHSGPGSRSASRNCAGSR